MIKQQNLKRIFSLIFLFSFILLFINSLTVTHALTTEDVTVGDSYQITYSNSDQVTTDSILEKYKGLLVFISGIGTITAAIFFVIYITKLGASAGNPMQRHHAVVGLIWSGVSIALLGSVAMWFGYFFYFLKDNPTS